MYGGFSFPQICNLVGGFGGSEPKAWMRRWTPLAGISRPMYPKEKGEFCVLGEGCGGCSRCLGKP